MNRKAAEKNLTEDDWNAKSFEASQLFSPSAPINEHELFAGRGSEIRKVLEAVTERGKHVVLFGERGVGKTSLSQIFSGLFPTTLKHISLFRAQVDPTDSFSSVWRKVFRDLHVRIARAAQEQLVPLADFFPSDIYPDDVRREFEAMFSPSDIPIIVIDEFDKAADHRIHELMANTIKALSDYSVNVTVILVGVADDINELVGRTRIDRALHRTSPNAQDGWR
jgi:energy-coupling factor transporter ATP-binding protein EcfA2